MHSFFSIFILAIGLAIGGASARAASCCGGGSSLPSLITSDDKAILATEASYSVVRTEVSSAGRWQDRNEAEATRTMKLSAAHVLYDRFQAGASISAINRSRAGEDSSGLGDTVLNFGYEALPDWDYNPWRPKGVVFLSLTAPTGRSIQEASQIYQLDARGRGFWAVGGGFALTKQIRRWDWLANLELHHASSKEVTNETFSGEVVPGWGSTFALGGGYSIRDYRLGAALTLSYEDAIQVRGSINSEGSLSRYATGSLQLSRSLDDLYSIALSYSDQTLFGSPLSTSLSRAFALNLQRRFSR